MYAGEFVLKKCKTMMREIGNTHCKEGKKILDKLFS